MFFVAHSASSGGVPAALKLGARRRNLTQPPKERKTPEGKRAPAARTAVRKAERAATEEPAVEEDDRNSQRI